MSKYHAPSLSVSIAVHILALFLVLFLYKSANILIEKVQKEKRVCINLNICVPNMEKSPKEEVKSQKKQLKNIIKKEIKPEKKQLKKILKKEVKKIEPPSNPEVKTTAVVVKKIIKKIPQKKVIVKKVEQLPEIPLQAVKKLSIVPKKTTQEIYINNHISKISQLLSENLYYPRRARKRGVTGEVLVKFTLSKDALVSNTNVITSPSELLSRAAIKTIKDLSGKFPQPDEVIVLQVPIIFSLR